MGHGSAILKEFGKWVFFAIIVNTLICSNFYQVWEDSAIFAKSDIAQWRAANVWLASAECSRQTGAWLAICYQGSLKPIADFAYADDIGHALILDIVANVTDRTLNFAHVARLNVLLNLLGLIILAAVLVKASLYLTAITFVSLSGVIYFSAAGISPHYGLIGVASLSAILPLALIFWETKLLSRNAGLIFVAIGLLALALATVVRAHLGAMGLLTTGLVIVWVIWKRRRSHRPIGELLMLAALAIAMWLSPTWALLARDALFPIAENTLIQSHGTSHNLYIGLGVTPNKWGIKWDDNDAAAAVKAVDPTIRYLTPEYYRVLWSLYLQKWMDDPIEVMSIYTSKAWSILKNPFPYWPTDVWLPLWQVIVLAILIMYLVGYKNIWKEYVDKREISILGVSLIFILLFVAQGMLAHPSRQYSSPIDVFVLLMCSIAVEWVLRTLLFKKLPPFKANEMA